MDVLDLLGTTLGLAFVAGINLYATVLVVGLGVQFGLIELPAELNGLNLLTHPAILVAAGIGYTAEFFADKIPWVDSLWDGFHTFIRPFGAALIALTAVGSVDPLTVTVLVLLSGGLALSTHSTKAATRLAVNQSPEPFTNIALSTIEDVGVIGGIWLAVAHPVVMLVLVGTFAVVFAFAAPRAFRLLRMEFLAVRGIVRAGLLSLTRSAKSYHREMPEGFANHLKATSEGGDLQFCLRCVSGKAIGPGRRYLGYLCVLDREVVFLTRRRLRIRTYRLDPALLERVALEKRLLMDRVVLRSPSETAYVSVSKDQRHDAIALVDVLSKLLRDAESERQAV